MCVPAFLVLTVLICFINLCKLTTVYFDNGGTYEYDQDGLGSYSYTLYLPDQSRYERGMMEKNGYAVYGEYFFSYQGKTYRTSYTADANGYRTHTHFIGKTVSPPIYLPPEEEEEEISSKAAQSILGTRSGK